MKPQDRKNMMAKFKAFAKLGYVVYDLEIAKGNMHILQGAGIQIKQDPPYVVAYRVENWVSREKFRVTETTGPTDLLVEHVKGDVLSSDSAAKAFEKLLEEELKS